LSENENTALNYYFKQFPDSNLSIQRAKTIESLSYEWTNYDYVFYEGQMPTQSAVRQMQRFTEQASGTLILIPTANFDIENWNRSQLKSLVEFSGHFASENGVDQFILNATDFRNAISYNSTGQTQAETVSLYRGLKAKLAGQEILIGNRQLQLLIYNEKKRVYTFLSPLDQTSTNFVTDSRFVPVIYSLLFTELLDNRYYPDRKEAAVFSKTYQAQLMINAETNYTLNAIRRLNNQTIYSVPERVPSANYSYEIDQANHILAVNKPALQLESLSTDNKQLVEDWTTHAGQTGSSVWRLFLILALFFYLAELWLGKASYKNK
ncbi:MAG: hypothetical protein KDD94_03120, partial [Calditrichaeota bacterium]|nr:hypothetical protein [Calditrichota bacterium]